LHRLLWLALAASFLVAASCGGQTSTAGTTTPATSDCSSAAVPTYSELTIWPLCTTCHSSALTGSARSGAPPSVNFDSYSAAAAHAAEAVAEIDAGRMPPAGASQPSSAQVTALTLWTSCGTPN
jgi:uncharacterized membrane protein